MRIQVDLILNLIHVIFQDIRGFMGGGGWRYPLILMGIREWSLRREGYYIPIFIFVI